ncbi:mpv17-like protein 2 isoform X2 [Anolis carolinensis]|uniref:mpv17-like protein 2 isoform X2 n=1 Tax=Anolis carolinensis TaxID=28377 RepID=UPI002F2B5704
MNPADIQQLQQRVQTLQTQVAALSPALRTPTAMPDKFCGEAKQVKDFVGQCDAYITVRPADFPTEEAKVGFIYSLLGGPALSWATALREAKAPVLDTATGFMEHLRDTWGRPVNKEEADRVLSSGGTEGGDAAPRPALPVGPLGLLEAPLPGPPPPAHQHPQLRGAPGRRGHPPPGLGEEEEERKAGAPPPPQAGPGPHSPNIRLPAWKRSPKSVPRPRSKRPGEKNGLRLGGGGERLFSSVPSAHLP